MAGEEYLSMNPLARALNELDTQDVQNNPWLSGARAANQYQIDPSTMSPGQILLTQALKGLGTGLSAGYGSKQIEASQQARHDKLYDMMSGSTPLADALAGDEEFKPYATQYKLFDEGQKRARLDSLNSKLIDKGFQLDENGAPQQIFDPIAQKAAEAGAIEKAKIDAQATSGGIGTRAEAEARDALTKLDSTKTFGRFIASLETMNSAGKLKTRAGDQVLMQEFAKIKDPTGTVKEGEYRLSQEAADMLSRVAPDWKEVVMGGGILSEKSRAAITKAASQYKNSYQNAFTRDADPFVKGALEKGARREFITNLPFGMIDEAAGENGAGVQAVQPVEVGGNKYVQLPNGKWGLVK